MTELPEVLPATGTAWLAWLLFALPALGAVVLLVAGRRADRVGPLARASPPSPGRSSSAC